MKALKTFTIALAVSSFSFGALAATEITQAQVKQNNYQQLGAVGSTNEAMDPMDVKKILSEKADKMGGQYGSVKNSEFTQQFIRGNEWFSLCSWEETGLHSQLSYGTGKRFPL